MTADCSQTRVQGHFHSSQWGQRSQNYIQAAVCNEVDWTDILLLSCLRSALSIFPGGVCVVISPSYCRAALPLPQSWGRAPPTAPRAQGRFSVSRLDLSQQGVLRQKRNVKIMPSHPADLPAWIQKHISHTVFSESPRQSILDCYAAQEPGQGERCDPFGNVSVAKNF